MTEVELSAGSILYEDTGGEGPVVVLCHGLLMTASLWDAVVAELGPGFRCVRPTLPLGAHRRPMRAEPTCRCVARFGCSRSSLSGWSWRR